MPFCNRIGNETAKISLEKMVREKKVPSTLLFAGPEGVGKSLFAIDFVKLLMGDRHHLKIDSQNHPDLIVLKPVGKGALHPIESIRSLIKEASLPPFEAPVKVFIIHDAHQMLPSSSNALLKILEEPFAHSYFLLLSDQSKLLLPTIASRCRCIPFFSIPKDLIEAFLIRSHQIPESTAKKLSLLSHGSFSKALECASALHVQRKEILIELLTCDTQREYTRFLKLCTQIEETFSSKEEEDSEETPAKSSYRETEFLFEEIFAWYRDRHAVAAGISPLQLYYCDHHETLQSIASQSLPPLERVFELLETSLLALQRHVKLRTILEHFFLNQF
ncbi:MAG: hypothetical protein HYZ48_04885 [Chlamydiales bacterium]|nr:hypothetical protein [Chlamydiales bacterium]